MHRFSLSLSLSLSLTLTLLDVVVFGGCPSVKGERREKNEEEGEICLIT
jgi:hypothetical protein